MEGPGNVGKFVRILTNNKLQYICFWVRETMKGGIADATGSQERGEGS